MVCHIYYPLPFKKIRKDRVWPLAEACIVERQMLVSWVEKQCVCRRCNSRLRLSKAASHQVGVCARLHFVCERSCAQLKPLETSAAMHGDDYKLNSLLNYAITACAISFERIVPALELLGMRAISTTDHYNFKVVLSCTRVCGYRVLAIVYWLSCIGYRVLHS